MTEQTPDPAPDPEPVEKVPIPELVEEARALLDLLTPMLERTQKGTGETLRFTLSIPVEDATLAAWLTLKHILRREGNTGTLYRSVMLKREDGFRMADWHRAKHYFQQEIHNHLAKEFLLLSTRMHALLYPPPPPREPNPDEMDDDIPF